MDNSFESWEQEELIPDYDDELKKMRKNLRRRNRKIVLTSVLLVIAILFSAVKFGIPALEKQYWDPTSSTYLEGIPDVTLTMNIYNELFGHGKHLMDVDIQKQGFADYALEACFVEYQTMHRLADVSYRTADITKGQVHMPTNFWLDLIPGSFLRSQESYGKKNMQLHKKNVLKTLRGLPDYVQLCAAITFPEDLTLDQLQQLQWQDPQNVRFLWAVLRCNDPDEDYITPCGFHLTEYMSERYDPGFWAETAYPKLFTERYNWSYQDMEQHILSSLRFSLDQLQQGTGFLPTGEDSDYYQQVLNYFQENGIKTYGCYIITTPQTLLQMLEEGSACYISITDAWIGF